MRLIESRAPTTWQDLEANVGRILQECGFIVELQRELRLVRGAATVDVFAVDPSTTPASSVVVECKNWDTAIPQHVVNAFRTVVGDAGANRGVIVSAKGFQAGALRAAEQSNILLLDWVEFQDLFAERWIRHYMLPRLREEVDPLVEYTEPINTRIFRKADDLPPDMQDAFKARRAEFQFVAWQMPWFVLPTDLPITGPPIQLPLRAMVPLEMQNAYPDYILDEVALRPLMASLTGFWRSIIDGFDELFGGRA